MQRDPLIRVAALEAQDRLNDAIGAADTVARALHRKGMDGPRKDLCGALDQMNKVNNWLLAIAGQ